MPRAPARPLPDLDAGASAAGFVDRGVNLVGDEGVDGVGSGPADPALLERRFTNSSQVRKHPPVSTQLQDNAHE